MSGTILGESAGRGHAVADGAALVARLRFLVRGAVQGVGFRPFVYRLATELGLAGWVSNSLHGVSIEVEGGRDRLEDFIRRVDRERPPRAVIHELEYARVDPTGEADFAIRRGEASGIATAVILPDLGPCRDCLREIEDPANRRYRYPFTNCVHCGPRFSIIESLPYDRANTTMRRFSMCASCLREYEDPLDRRFHAQPNACPDCGPHLELWDEGGRVLSTRHDALRHAADAIRDGSIVAIKGVGGFHLVVDARNERAVARLRARKHRPEKPLAVLFPSIEAVAAYCEVSDVEAGLLEVPAAPIVLLRARGVPGLLCASVAPRNPYLGAMLPPAPLHHLLMNELAFPVVATSGNRADEPICIREDDALERFSGLADCLLVHDRPIARHADDSVVRVVMGDELVLRRARGYAPLPIPIKTGARRVLAVGGHLKNAVALTVGDHAVLSQHIGNLDASRARDTFRSVIHDLAGLYGGTPACVACDLHPDDAAARYARELGIPVVGVQHQYAHVLSCMAEHDLDGAVLGVAWDGTGYGLDGTIWGGEFLLATRTSFQRVGHFRTFRLPGGNLAVREPKRAALGVLFEIFGSQAFGMAHLAPITACSVAEARIIGQMLARGVNAPITSSAGRLFDAVSSLAGLCHAVTYEGQAAMALEYAVERDAGDERYPFGIEDRSSVMVVDWELTIRGILEDLARGTPSGRIAAKFHHTLAEIVVSVAQRVGQSRVVLTGGCFQNAYLTERAATRLAAEGFRTYRHGSIPPNDGGIALGQAVAAIAAVEGGGPR